MATKRRKTRTASKRIRRVGSRVGSSFQALQIPSAVMDAARNAGGMLAAQFFSKRFSPGGGLRDQWTWRNHTMAVIGSFASGLVAEMIRRGSGKQFLQGGLALVMYRLISDNLSNQFPFIQTNFGVAEQGFLGTDGKRYLAGDTYSTQSGETFVMGSNGIWMNTDDSYRLTPGMGETVAPAGSLGETVAPAGSLGNDPYAKVFSN